MIEAMDALLAAARATRAHPQTYFLDPIRHYVYAGDTLLHAAAAAFDAKTARALVEEGADGSTPLDLARMTTGRGGTGSPEMKKEQAALARLLA